jgi:hypothetical protein
MKRTLQISALLLASIIGVGCRAQVPAGPQNYNCPAATVNGTAYTPLNPASNTANPPVSGLTYTDGTQASLLPAGNYCYIVQSWVSPNSSGPSNIAQAILSASGVVNLAWTAPTGVNTSGYTYVLSRAAAIPVALPMAPTLSTPTAAATLNPPPDAKPAPAFAEKPSPPSGMVASISERPAR